MKLKDLLVAVSIVALGFLSPLVASGETSEAAQSQLDAPMPVTDGSVTYLTGGIGDSEAESIRAIAKNYLLEVIFVQKFEQKEEFLAEVKVKIQDRNQNLILDITTEGPYLLANLPKGHYQIIAEYNGNVKQQWVDVGDINNKKSKHKKVVFWWSV
jgi:hypothetical protein